MTAFHSAWLDWAPSVKTSVLHTDKTAVKAFVSFVSATNKHNQPESNPLDEEKYVGNTCYSLTDKTDKRSKPTVDVKSPLLGQCAECGQSDNGDRSVVLLFEGDLHTWFHACC
jgi:hypothetical protein